MIHHGKAAIRHLESHLKRPLTQIERRVVWLEGYADTLYQDTKGIWTIGVGQTGEWINKGFTASFDHHVARAKKRIPQLDVYPMYLQCELIQAEYRGDLGLSPKACNLINAGKYESAGTEFLNNAEYRTAPMQIQRRMEAVAVALTLYGLTDAL